MLRYYYNLNVVDI